MTYDSAPIRRLREAMFAFNAAHPAPSIETMREGIEAIAETNLPATDLSVEPIELGGVPAVAIAAPGASKDRVIYHLHGGGYVAGSPASHQGMLGELSRAAKSQVFVLDYSKAPEHPFPTSYDESIRGYEAIRASGRPFAVTGDSAGGGMALGVLAYAASKGHKEARAGFLISPWSDLTLMLPSLTQLADRDPAVNVGALRRMVEAYASGHDLKDRRISPMFAKLENLPPLLIHVGSDEALLDDALEIDRRVRAAGGESHLEVWPEMLHVWHVQTASLPQACDALQRAGEFLLEHLQKQPGASRPNRDARETARGENPMSAATNPPGTDWMQIVKKNGTSDFAASFTPDAALQTSVLSKEVVGPDLIGAFFSATSKMYDRIGFTAETTDGGKTYLEWDGLFAGKPVAGATMLTRDESGRISNVKLFHSPLPIVRDFSSGLKKRLARTLGQDFFD